MRVHGDVVSEWDHAGVVRACTTAGSAYSRVLGALRSTHVLSGTAWRAGAGAVTMLRGRAGGYRGAVFCGQRRHGGRLERCALRERSRPHVRFNAAWDTMLYGIPSCAARTASQSPCRRQKCTRVRSPRERAMHACTGALSRKACVWRKPWLSVRTHSRVHRVGQSLWSASVRAGSRWRVRVPSALNE